MTETKVNLLIYILDDDIEEFEDIVKPILQEYGMNDFVFHSKPLEFLENIGSDINILIIDHLLPGRTGIEVVKEVRKKNKKSFIIIMTGIEDFDVAVKYIKLKIDAWINKNWNDYRERLVETLQEALIEAKERIEEKRIKEKFIKLLEEKMSNEQEYL